MSHSDERSLSEEISPVEVAEEVDVLVCSAVRCDVGEVKNVAEKDGR